MTNINFDFLAGLEPVTIEKQVKEKVSRVIPKNPEGMKLRIFKDGSVYPSQELVDAFDLEYQVKGFDQFNQMGFDVFSSSNWGQMQKGVTPFVCIVAVPKSEAKLDLFKSVDYNEDGTPKKSVLNQGSKRPEIIEMLREVYNLPEQGVLDNLPYSEDTMSFTAVDKLFGSKNYVDLEVVVDTQVFPELNAYYIPKILKKGLRAGQQSYEERAKGTAIYPLVISMEVTEEVNQVEEVLEETA